MLPVCLQKGTGVSDTVLGEGGTTAWKMCGLDKSTCLTVLFDLSPGDKSSNAGTVNPQLYLQFRTRFDSLTSFLFCTSQKVFVQMLHDH